MQSNPQFEKVLLFGGSGFIGSHLVERLLESPMTQVTIVDAVAPKKDWGDRVRFIEADIRKPLELAPDGSYDLVVNLAAIAKEPGYSREMYYDTNDLGAKHVVDYMVKSGLKTLWFTSSMSTYGPSEVPCTEDAPQNPTTWYGDSKKRAEVHHNEWVEEDESRRLIMCRPAVIFGPGEGGNFTRLARSLKNRRFMYPGRRDTIKANGYVGDLVESFFFVHSLGLRRAVFNFAYPQKYTIQSIVEAFCETWKLPPSRGTVPKSLVMAGANVLKIANRTGLSGDIHPDRVRKLLLSTNIVPTFLNEHGFQWPTKDLRGGLQAWLDRCPGGEYGQSK